MNRIITFILFTSLCFGNKIILERNQINQPPGQQPPDANLTLHITKETGSFTTPVHQFQRFRMFRGFPLPELPRGVKDVDTVNALVLRVEFVEDDVSYTTGNGKMDFIGFGNPEDGLFYDPPHTKQYFERNMKFLSNYYKSNSFGQCIVTWTVKPDMIKTSYQLPHKMSYYSGFDHYDSETGYVYYNWYAMEMGLVRILADAIAAADLDPTVNFSDYDAVLVFHAGTLLQTSLNFYRFCDIPSATIPSGALEYYLGIPYILANAGNDTIWGGAINSEMARVDEYMVGGIGTVVHEFGHTLGLPDLYDVSGWSNGVGAWDLMSNGGWVGDPYSGAPEGSIPANLGAWTRYALGWVDPLVVTEPESLLTLRASEIDTTQYNVCDQTMIKIPISQNEFFLIENRQQDIAHKDTIIVDVEGGVPIYIDNGEYDFFLPGRGILIWHIDDNVINANWANNTIQIDPYHKGIDVEEADGIQHFDAWWYGDDLEYFGSFYDPFFVDDSNKANHHFGPFTKPNSDSYYGKSLIDIDVKSKPDTLMNFSLDFDTYQTGFPVTVRQNHAIYSLSYGDLDGNGDLEVIVATTSNYIYVFNHDGSFYDSTSVDDITTYLAVGDITGDGADDIVFGAGVELIGLNGPDLEKIIFNVSTITNDVILGAPLLYDIDGDGELEVIFGSKDRTIYCLNYQTGSIGEFPIYLNSELVSTPCVFDENERQIGVLGSDGRFWIMNKDGIVKEFTESAHNMYTYASPVVGDMDRDGNPEAVIINGYGTIYIYGSDTLEKKFDILIDTTFYFTPALADIDQDGYLEIIMPNSSKTLYVTNRNGTSENNFPIHADEFILHPLLIADFDPSDGIGEQIVFGRAMFDSLGFGQLKIINNRNKEFDYSPLFGEGGFSSPGAIFDIDQDGDLELACGSDAGKLYIWDFPITNASWKGYMNSPKNWGRFDGNLVQPHVASTLLGSFYMYPSPIERYGKVRFFLNQESEVNVEIIDITGHKISGINLDNATPNEYNEVEFDFLKQSNGVYIVRIEAKNGEKREVKFKKFAVLK